MPVWPLYSLLWLFFLYSLLGWILESVFAAVRRKRFINRGVLNGPLCCIYGFSAVAITVGLNDLKESLVFLFLGAAIIAGLIEWFSGRLLEKLYRRKWWDYSKQRFHIDGYVSLRSAALWGVIGVLGLRFLNPLLLDLMALVPPAVLKIILWVAVALTALDAVGSYLTLLNPLYRDVNLEKINDTLLRISHRLNRWITGRIQQRMERAYPTLTGREKPAARVKSAVFAEGCGFYKIFLLFLIGAFLGDLTETVFCRVTAGVWMSRSSVVWGPFSVVWGLGLALGTLVLYNYRDQSDSFIFTFGAVLGGAFEYLCSVFTELAFGKVFWDYSHIPFNLGGRINLLYCFFWGIAAVVWLKKLYPLMSGWIEKIPMKPGKIITWCLAVFMAANLCVSVLALARSQSREAGESAGAAWEQLMDAYYGDEVLARIYPNSISTNQ
ncbi:MAG: hypothetical protein EOM52_01435 [Clostridia bacterium]|nr:hypothetical protein [Clostridia bacterium]